MSEVPAYDEARGRPPRAIHTQPDHYAIRVEGHLDPGWSEWFEGLTVTLLEDGNTMLSGPVVDQTALHGLLARVRDLNLPLISVSRLDLERINEDRRENP